MSSAHITWKDPTVRVGGTALAAADLAAVLLDCSRDGGPFERVARLAPGIGFYDYPVTQAGFYSFRVLALDAQVPPKQSAPSVVCSARLPPPQVVHLDLEVEVSVDIPIVAT